MNRGAIAHMPDSRWCYCLEPGRFLFRLQTGRDDIQQVILHHRDKYLPVKLIDTRDSIPMNRVAQDDCHDYYEVELSIDVVCLRYFFELTDRTGNHLYYSNCQFLAEAPEDNDRMYDLPQTLRETERFQVPQWAENKIVYQVFPSRFASSQNVDPKVWYQTPIRHNTDLKGDLKGIALHLDHLVRLGVDVLYMTPIFQSNSTHKYDTIDYYTIDPSFGSTQDLIDLVEQAHKLGIRVILDAVFNHTAPEFFAFRDLEKNWEHTPYRSWYYTKEKPKRPLIRLSKPNYKCFSYFGGMPKVNLDYTECGQYFIDVALYWLRTAKIDGWRLDVGDEVSHYFWRRFRTAVKAEFPDALIVGEVWHYAADFLQGDAWDSVMNYPFLNAAMDLVAEQTLSPSGFLNQLGFLRGNYHNACHSLLWNLLGSHDTPRALHRCNGNLSKMKLLASLQLLLPGMPFIYYGDEVGLSGGRDPDCRRGMLWDESRQNQELLAHYCNLIAIRKANPFLTQEPPKTSMADDNTGMIALRWNSHTLIFNASANSLPLPQYTNLPDLIGHTPFCGTLPPWQVCLLKLK